MRSLAPRRSRTFVATALVGLSARAWAASLSVAINGQDARPVRAVRCAVSYCVSAEDAARVYGGRLYWYPVSGRMILGFGRRQAQLVTGSAMVRFSGGAARLQAPVVLRGSSAYIPLSLFLSRRFAVLCGMDTVFDAQAQRLLITGRRSVGPVSYQVGSGSARLTVSLGSIQKWRISRRDQNALEAVFDGGRAVQALKADPQDAWVSSYALNQQRRSVRLDLSLAQSGVLWQAREETSPARELVIELSLKGQAPQTAQAEPQASSAAVRTAGAASSLPSAPDAAEVASLVPPTLFPGPSRGGTLPRLVIDAGHGGKDSGALGRLGTVEKRINLSVALELARLVRSKGGFEVRLTRGDDTFIPLSGRSQIANDFKADLFVSLHCNSSRHRSDAGYEVYSVSDKASDPEAERLAAAENSVTQLESGSAAEVQASVLLHEMNKSENINTSADVAAAIAKDLRRYAPFKDGGVKQAGFYVLRGADAPAVLVEMGYISNSQDAAKLKSKKNQKEIARGIYQGLLDYARQQGWLVAGSKSL